MAKPDGTSRFHSVAARRLGQGVAFGILRGLAGLALVSLACIIGFVMYRGFVSDNLDRSQWLPYAEPYPDNLAFVTSREVELDSIDFATLLGLFTDEYVNWAKIAEENLDVTPISVDAATPAGLQAEQFLFGPVPLWGGLVSFMPDAASALKAVALNPGACALVPATALPTDPAAAGLRVVPVRRLAVAAHPEVTAIVDNRAIDTIPEASLADLLAGRIADWSRLEGPALPVTLFRPALGSALEQTQRAAGVALPGEGTPAAAATPDQPARLATIALPQDGSPAGLAAAIAATPGAFGVVYGSEALQNGLSLLNLERRVVKPNLTLQALVEAPGLSGKTGGISTIILNTLIMIILTLAVAVPVGVAAAVFLVEYARQGRLVTILRMGTETLAGIPSIIFGLFGMVFFVQTCGFGIGLISGTLTLVLMILPTIVRTSEEALKAVSPGLREGSLALGATRLQTILRVVIPAASRGILNGIVLASGRAAGESAALIFTMGSDYNLVSGLDSSARSLAVHVYLLVAEGISFDRSFASAAALVIIILAMNFVAARLADKSARASR